MNYVRKFSPNLVQETKPLILLKKNVDWSWNETHERAFHTIKDKRSSPPILAHYDPNKETMKLG